MNARAKETATAKTRLETRAAGLLDFAQRSHGRAVAILVVLALIAFLPGFVALQPMDRDEPRFAQASKQMLETGDFVAIRFQNDARNKKPVGIHWLQAAAVALGERLGVPDARTTIALYRLPSLIGAVATVLLTYWAALALVGRREAFLAAAFMAASLLLGVEARLAKTDAVLAACCVAAMGGLARAYMRLERAAPAGAPLDLPLATALGFWVAIGLSVLVKGPIGPLIVGLGALSLALYERSGRWLLALRPGLGVVLALAIVAPWFVAIAAETKGAFFVDAVGTDMLGKVAGVQERHWGPPGAYLLAFFATFWPAAAFAANAVPSVWGDRRLRTVAFCLAWIVPFWLILELLPTKLPHYVLPLYPAVAILTARALLAGAIVPGGRGSTAIAFLLPLVAIGVLAALSIADLRLDNALPYVALPALLLAAVLAILAWGEFRRAGALGAALAAIAASLVLSIGGLGLAHTAFRSLKVSERLADAAHILDCPDPRYATAGYREPSLVFLIGTNLIMTDGAGAAAFVNGGRCRMAFVEASEDKAFADALRRVAASPSLITHVTGFNVNGGRKVDVAVYVSGP